LGEGLETEYVLCRHIETSGKTRLFLESEVWGSNSELIKYHTGTRCQRCTLRVWVLAQIGDMGTTHS